jgi:hypothetical protein
MDASDVMSLTAVTGDPSGQGVTWTGRGTGCPDGNCGTLNVYSYNHFTANYDPPGGMTGQIQETITATSVANPSNFATISFNVNLGPSLVTTSLPNATYGSPYTAALKETNGTTPFTWSISPQTPLPQGLSLNPDGSISGTPQQAGKVTLFVTLMDAVGSEVQGNVSFTINPNGALPALNGHYTFTVGGSLTLQAGLGATAGSVHAAPNGVILGGVMDATYQNSIDLFSQINPTSTYLIGKDGRGVLLINNNSQEAFAYAFAISASSSGTATAGSLVELDPEEASAGTFQLQDSTLFSGPALSGTYVFHAAGEYETPLSTIVPYSIAGEFTANLSEQVTGGEEDFDDAGTTGTNTNLSGSYTWASTSRGVLKLSDGFQYVYYVVDANTITLLCTGLPPTNSMLGVAKLQTGSSFSNASLDGKSIYYSQAVGSTDKSSNGQVGIVNFDGGGNFTLSADQNNAGSASTILDSGNYSVSTEGRTALNGTTHSWVIYLQDNNLGALVGTDAGATSGEFYPQQSMDYSVASFSGTFGVSTQFSLVYPLQMQSGLLFPDGSGNLTGTLDLNQAGTPTQDATFSTTYKLDSSGRGTMAASGVTGATVFYMVSPNQVFAIPTDSSIVAPLVQEWISGAAFPSVRGQNLDSSQRQASTLRTHWLQHGVVHPAL